MATILDQSNAKNNQAGATYAHRSHFVIVPHVLKTLLKGDGAAVLLYLHILDVAGNGGQCWQSNKTIADAIGYSERTVREKRQLLAERGLVSIEVDAYHSTMRVTIADIWSQNAEHVASEAAKNGRGGMAKNGRGGWQFLPPNNNPRTRRNNSSE